MSKLSYSDRQMIADDIRLRRDNEHLMPCWNYVYPNVYGFAGVERKNDYLDFIYKCSSHATMVGDDVIWEKLCDELCKWKEVT